MFCERRLLWRIDINVYIKWLFFNGDGIPRVASKGLGHCNIKMEISPACLQQPLADWHN